MLRLFAALAAFALLAFAGCGTTDDSSSGGSTGSGESGAKSESDGCGFKATDDCTPHVGADGKVRVDAIVWNLESARTTNTIGEQQYGLGAKADGVFVVVKLKATSKKDESATLSDNVIKLEVNGNTYDPDSDGSIAAIGAGDEPFFLETLNPDSTEKGTVVFDVPKKVLNDKPELRFGELGFGDTHAYIALPQI
ncbi:DUF4352 domain-containing protein [Capillimicrobium parvum]|uniref:DUF4352 domain-containing protein n=1 Tax=Capillimicrobium parvum TaxID=2884022 RepID=A0A9E6XW65_9ACTN|nr:DUF4352 domain-containing protein [Capillimicrobium parvum]UGS35243.1 hypothetical protein DSM104329_01629 [Capillimicrobium parvum]